MSLVFVNPLSRKNNALLLDGYSINDTHTIRIPIIYCLLGKLLYEI